MATLIIQHVLFRNPIAPIGLLLLQKRSDVRVFGHGNATLSLVNTVYLSHELDGGAWQENSRKGKRAREERPGELLEI